MVDQLFELRTIHADPNPGVLGYSGRMMRTIRTSAILITIAALAACTDRPVEITGEQTTSAAASSTSGGAPTSGGPITTTGGPGTTGASDTTTSGGPGTTDTPGTTTAATAETSMSSDDTSGGSSTTMGGPPGTCGPPCAETWEAPGDLIVDVGKDDLSKYACLTRVHGDLTLTGNNADLSPFANLQDVDNALGIFANFDLVDLSAFACLRHTNGVHINIVPTLADASALAGLEQAPDLWFSGTNLAALPSFAPGFPGIWRLFLTDNPKLVDINEVAAWDFVGGNDLVIRIETNDLLTSIAPIGGLLAQKGQSTMAGVSIARLPLLASLTGLDAFDNGSLELIDLPLVPDLQPLSALTHIEGGLVLAGMPKVKSLAGLGSLSSAYLLTLGECVNGNPNSLGMAGITSLAGLDNLATLDSFGLANNQNLDSLAGAPKLKQVSAMVAIGNPALTQAAVNTFVAQLDAPPNQCLGDWNACDCFGFVPP